MLHKIQDHFILIDKCAGQTRIVEIKDRTLTKYICWPDSSPPIIGNIYKADIIKKLNGGVVRAKTKDQRVLTVRGVPKHIKANSKIDLIITSEQYDDKPVQAKIFLEEMSDFLKLSNIQRIIDLFFTKNLPIVEDYYAIYWNILDLDKIFLKALSPRVEIKGGGVLWIQKTKTATLIDIDTHNLLLVSDEANFEFCKKAFIKCIEEIKLRNIGGMIIIDFPRFSFDRKQKINEFILNKGKEYFSDGRFLGFSRLQLYELYIPRNFPPLESFYINQEEFEFQNHLRSLWRKSKENKSKANIQFICGNGLYKKIKEQKLPPFFKIIERLDLPNNYGELMEKPK
jgi:hypothetical protein